MASGPYIPSWLRIILTTTHEGNTQLLPMDYQFTGISKPSVAQILEALTNLWGLMGAHWAAQHCNSFTATQLVGTDMSAAGRNTATYIPTTNNVGTKAGDALPANCAGVCTWRSGRTGRSFRGRTYFYGFQEQDAVGSFFTVGALSTLSNLAADIKNFSNGSGSLPLVKVIPSRKLLQLTQVQSAFIDNTVDSQRRRLPGRGI